MTARPHRRVLALLLAAAGAGLHAQQPAPPAADPAAIQPPALPADATPATPAAPVLPPKPGELKAAPAPAAPALPGIPPPPPGLLAPATSPSPAPARSGVSTVPLPRARATSSTSTTGQFIVHGETLPLRSAFSSKCEDIATDLRKLLHDKQPWSIPIVVLLSTGEAAAKAPKPVSTTISQLSHGGFHIQVTIHLRPDLRQADARREIIRALLAGRILRDKKQITAQRPLLLPDWLFTGILEALDYRTRTRPSALFAAIFQSGKIYSIEEIIEAVPGRLDGLSNTIYQVSCCALVLALLDLPDGGPRMADFLSALATDPRPERQLLDSTFPAIASSPSSLNKWWSVQLATLASPSMAEPLGIEESLQELQTALTFQVRARPSELPRRPAAAPVAAIPPSKTEASTTPPELEENPVPASRRGFFSRLNPFSRDSEGSSARADDADSVIAAAIEQTSLDQFESSAAPPAEMGADDEDEPGRPSLLARILGRDRPDEPAPPGESPAPPAEKPAPKAKAKAAAQIEAPAPPEKPSASEPSASESSDEVPRRSRLNPLNWFRRDGDDESETPAGDTPADPPTVQFHLPDLRLHHLPALWLHPLAAPPLLAQSFLGIRFGKKKDEPAAPEPAEAAPAAKTAPPGKDTPAKDSPAKEEPPPAAESREEAEDGDEPARRSKLNPLNWFRKDPADPDAEKDSSETPVETPATADSPPAPAAKPRTPAPESEPLVPVTLALEDYALLLKRKDAKTLLETSILALASLQNRAHVALRPVIADYSLLLSDLHQGKTKNADARIRELRARTRQAGTRARELRALLDLHEANTPHYLSGAFDDYLQLPQTLQKELPERTDPISRYLDSLEREFSTTGQ